jgi:hypothetical protein
MKIRSNYSIYTKAKILELSDQGLNYREIYNELIKQNWDDSFTPEGIKYVLRKMKRNGK